MVMSMEFGPVLDYRRAQAGRRVQDVRDWTQQELAQFYRVEWALGQSGIAIETDRGLSDEGDPWFAFCRASDAEVVIHIAREGDDYLLAGFLSDRVQRGRDFAHLVERLLAEHPAKAIDKRGASNVVMHPATLLALLVSIAFLQSNEGKAETTHDHSEDAGLLRSAAVSPVPFAGASLRSAATLTGSIVALAATLELAQAMTILRVAKLMDQDPADPVSGPHQDATAHRDSSVAWTPQDKRASTADAASTDHHQTMEAHASSALDMSSVSLPQAQGGGIDMLLQIVAKLWTFPDAGTAIADSLGVPAALAFFAGTTNGSGDLSVALRTHQQVRPQAEAPSGDAAIQHAAVQDQVPAGSTVTIIHTSGASDSMAQTMLKLSFADKSEVTIKAADVADAGKLVSLVSEIVAHAKGEISIGQGSVALSLGRVDLDAQPLLGGVLAEKLGDALAVEPDEVKELAAAPEKVVAEENYTTFFGDGAIKHNVLNKAGEASVERAIAAFKDDVAHYSIAVSGKDVIFYSPDAVIHHSSEVVVELWQFKDGSSIALVGLGLDGALPYLL